MTPNELMIFTMLAGVVGLSAAWAAARWRRGARDSDPGARLLALVAIGGLGGLVGGGPWSWIGTALGWWFWTPFAAAVLLFAADWLRERRARRRG